MFCKRCGKLTEWRYFGYATFHGPTDHCTECGASTYDGMADYRKTEELMQKEKQPDG